MLSPPSWETLTTLKLRDVPPVYAARILARTPALEHCWMRIWDDQPQPVSERSIVLVRLETFILDARQRKSMDELLRALVLPALQKFAIKEAFLNSLAPGFNSGEKDVASALLRLLQRWGCNASLSKLTILRSEELIDNDEQEKIRTSLPTSHFEILDDTEEWEPVEWGADWNPQGVL
uniref:Uncharacterized protein n=1 Tax=Mycena chlorophos TaxID=658473 RepID=A0ABQ0L064_MYCCL|nr:predicted protein [Mycena chlorophos]